MLRRIARSVELGKINADSPYPPELVGQDGTDECVRKALETGIPPKEVLNQGLVAGMKTVGDRFRDGALFLPEVLMAARALTAGFEHLKPYFRSGELKPKGTILIGTVAGDLHDIGKKIVSLFLEGGGWQVVDLGVDVPAGKFLAAIEAHQPFAVALSTLLTTTMASMEAITREIKAQRPGIRVIVGGAPLTRTFADRIGADKYSADPQGALDFLDSANREINACTDAK